MDSLQDMAGRTARSTCLLNQPRGEPVMTAWALRARPSCIVAATQEGWMQHCFEQSASVPVALSRLCPLAAVFAGWQPALAAAPVGWT